jgi:integrase
VKFSGQYVKSVTPVLPRGRQMPRKKLTDLFVERVKPPEKGRVEYFDAVFGGLALRVTDTGHKSWSVHYRLGNRLRRYTIGNYPAIKPAQARREASAALERVRQGTDPTEAKRQRRMAGEPEVDTFTNALRDYLDRAQRNTAPATFAEVKRVLEREFLPAWRKRPIASITRGDVNRIVDGIAGRGAEIQANRSLAYLRACFNWLVERGRLGGSPLTGMKLPTREQTRDRVLNDDELRWLWRACEAVGWPFGPLVRLLLLTGQRRDEVASLERVELNVDRRTWTLPREKAKNNRAHEVQLSAAAIEVLNSAPPISARFVFTMTGTTTVSGFSRAKRRIDAAMLAAKRSELGEKCDPIPGWILHDLRRTAATGMARLNFPPHVVDKVLNHASGTIRGVAAIYNRFEYLEERRAALEAWGRYISELMSPPASNVLVLRN